MHLRLDSCFRVVLPQNAIAYRTGYIRTRDMIRAGVALNVTGDVPVTLWMSNIMPVVLGIPTGLPNWAALNPW